MAIIIFIVIIIIIIIIIFTVIIIIILFIICVGNTYIDAQTKGLPVISRQEEIALYADRSYKKFEQVFINYGEKSNADLLLLYGFALDRNPFNSGEFYFMFLVWFLSSILNTKKHNLYVVLLFFDLLWYYGEYFILYILSLCTCIHL